MSIESTTTPSSTELAEQRTALAGDRTRWAADRTLWAADRTFIAWLRTSISMIGFGISIGKAGDALVQNKIITDEYRYAADYRGRFHYPCACGIDRRAGSELSDPEPLVSSRFWPRGASSTGNDDGDFGAWIWCAGWSVYIPLTFTQNTMEITHFVAEPLAGRSVGVHKAGRF